MHDMSTPVVKESHRAAVRARFLGPTNYRGSRIKVTRMDARTGDKTMFVPWDHALNIGENYAAAIRAYLDMMGWEGTWVVGGGTDGYVAVMVSREVKTDV